MGGKFKGKVALATGAGARMGLATAQAFARAVANVVLVDINEESVVTAAKASTKEGAKALTVRCDVASETDIGLTKSAAALWLCSSEASPVLGHALLVDGGYSAQ